MYFGKTWRDIDGRRLLLDTVAILGAALDANSSFIIRAITDAYAAVDSSKLRLAFDLAAANLAEWKIDVNINAREGGASPAYEGRSVDAYAYDLCHLLCVSAPHL
jgi:hypothetical protein